MKECTQSITIYNSYTDPTTKYKRYLPTVITGVSWFGEVQVSIGAAGLLSADMYTLRIPVDADFSNKTYLTPKDFLNIPNDRMSLYWTLTDGDIIVKGSVTDTGDDAKPAKLEAKYNDVITIVSVTDNRSRPNAKHWKVVGK